MTGWRRAFCTSIAKEGDDPVSKKKNANQSSKFGFFSNPSTPRLRSQPPTTPVLRCRTTAAMTPVSSAPNSPKLSQKPSQKPRFFQFASSNPSSPKSPSSFSLIKSSLRLSRSRCGICLLSVKSGQGTAIFTAECSHSFHFPCISSQVKIHQILSCPVCNSIWNEAPLLAVKNGETEKQRETTKLREHKPKTLRIYDDDEALANSVNGARFNPIPESDEYEEEEEDVPTAFHGFFTNFASSMASPKVANMKRNIDVSLLQEAAVISAGRSSENIAVVLRVKAPVVRSAPMKQANRAAIDVVAVVNVSVSSNLVKLQMIKRALRLAISSLCCSDRLSIVAFSTNSKRLFALRRMTTDGRRAARRIVDALCEVGQTACVVDALKKAAKVIEDRREKNSVAAILLLSDGQDEKIFSSVYSAQPSRSSLVSSTRLPHLDIPLHAVNFYSGKEPTEELLAQTVASLLSVETQDIKLQLGFVSGSAPAEIAGVYPLTGRPSSVGSTSIRIGDLYSGEERELLVELKVPVSSVGSHFVLAVRSTYTDPTSRDLVRSKEQALLVPMVNGFRSFSPTVERLRYLHLAIRGIAESRRLIERNDLSGAHHLLSSARALLMQRNSASAGEFIRSLEAELAELHRRWQQTQRRKINCRDDTRVGDQKTEALTPTSAWRAAERLAKVAIMRKSANRVSDLHGFENARF